MLKYLYFCWNIFFIGRIFLLSSLPCFSFYSTQEVAFHESVQANVYKLGKSPLIVLSPYNDTSLKVLSAESSLQSSCEHLKHLTFKITASPIFTVKAEHKFLLVWGTSRFFASIYCHSRTPVLKWPTKMVRSAQHQQKFMVLQFLHQSRQIRNTQLKLNLSVLMKETNWFLKEIRNH